MKSPRQPTKCIFCLEVKQASKEHIFPEAIGGKLSIFVVCRDCNNWLGGRIDSHLISLPTIQARRAQFGIAGKRKKVPNGYEILTGRSSIIDQNGDRQSAWVSYDHEKKLSLKLDWSVTEHKNDEGQTVVQISGDPSDVPKLMQKLQDKRRMAGLKPLSDEELEKIFQEADQQEITSPLVERRIEFDIFGVYLAFAKIAYELAFHWFGRDFSDEPYAEIFRAAIKEERGSDLLDYINILDQQDVAKTSHMWRRDASWHIGFANYIDGHTVIIVKLFDVAGAAIRISQRNWLAPFTAMKKSFVAVNAQTGEVYEARLLEEYEKLLRDFPQEP